MSDPTEGQVLASISTPIRDLRDEVWVRVYAATFVQQRDRMGVDLAENRTATT